MNKGPFSGMPSVVRHPMLRALVADLEDEPVVLGADRANGVIGLQGGRLNRPVCFCGTRNFESCDADGRDMRVVGEERLINGKQRHVAWPGLFRCDGCGAIVEADTRQVVGMAKS